MPFWFVGLAVNPHTEFEVSSYTHFRDMEGIPKFKNRSRDIGHAPIDLLSRFFWFAGLELNPHTKRQVCSFTHSRDIERVPKLKK